MVYNDFMNTLMSNPSTEKELPLIAAAAKAGAEYFCVDAGWFGDGNWWSSAGDWREAPGHFTGGLISVIDAIRAEGMRPGIWLEPEAVGPDSQLTKHLPEEAFFRRHGQRVFQTGHYQLDFRHPAARAHLDEAVDRLVDEFGFAFFKLDYNVNSGVGTDVDADGPGAGLLGHTRAFREWLSDAQARHPGCCSRAAPRAGCAWTTTCCRWRTCNPPATSRISGGTRRSPPLRPRAWPPNRPETGPIRPRR
ncbi:hypothetical protein GCM10029992_51280 [Glycomyces albus]